ncbi:hypothetical protein [Pseudorhodoferax sp.]|uniref:hypothetical protein n=1 Tax=Pseudorhodoferax sp. TaxID=1993553 RepID=UPI0039E69283
MSAIPAGITIKIFTAFLLLSTQMANGTPLAPEDSHPSVPEFVGRLKFSLLGQSEVSAYRFKRLQEEIQQESNQQWLEFLDGADGSYGRISTLGSHGYISHPLKISEFAGLLSDVKEWQGRARKISNKQTARSGDPGKRVFSEINIGAQDSVAWQFNGAYRFFVRIGDSALLWTVSAEIAKDQITPNTPEQLITGARARSLYEIPSDSGVCTPYALFR